MYYISTCDCTGCNALSVSSPATEEVSSPPASRKGGKGEADTAARRRKNRGGEDIPKSKKVEQSKSICESRKKGKRKRPYEGEEDSASSAQSSASSDEGQSSTSSEEGEDQCRE